ncbi:MAG: helix-turn-helix domain-containing protein [Blastocatellia bacterium]
MDNTTRSKVKKRRVTIIETHRIQIIRRRKPGMPAWCSGCSAHIQTITPEEAAALTQVTTRTIYRWVEAGELHFAETPEGALLICPDSLTIEQH